MPSPICRSPVLPLFAAEGGLKSLLSCLPQGVGFGELCAAAPDKGYQPTTSISWIDGDINKTIALQRLQRVGECARVRYQGSASLPTVAGSDRLT